MAAQTIAGRPLGSSRGGRRTRSLEHENGSATRFERAIRVAQNAAQVALEALAGVEARREPRG
jgi:hypothetical protein